MPEDMEDKVEVCDLEAKLGSITYESLSLRDAEITKLKNELKRLQTEKDSELAEEREARKIIEAKSLGLVSDIKLSQQKKYNDLANDLQLQKDIIKERDSQILELQDTITKLRAELKKFQSEVHSLQNVNGERQQQITKKYRGSISVMESRLHQNTAELENRIQDMNANHEGELVALQNALKRQEDEFSCQLDALNSEILELHGRLEESRNSRKATLEEMRQMRKKYSATIKKLENCLEEVVEKNRKLEDKDNTVKTHVSLLKDELETTRADKQNLSIRLEDTLKENKQKEEKLLEMDNIISRLEEGLKSLEQQKTDLISSTKEFLKKGQDYDVQLGATQVLQSQLEKCQAGWDDSKEALIKMKEKNRQAERDLSKMEKEFNSCKTDLRIIQREKKDLEERVGRALVEIKDLNGQVTEFENQRMEFEKNLSAKEKEITELKSKLEEALLDSEEMKTILKEKTEKEQQLQNELSNSVAEIGRLKAELTELESARSQSEQRDAVIKEKSQIIQDKDRKITQLLGSLSLLKEACSVLEQQLQSFEESMTSKNQQLEKLMTEKSALQAEQESLRDDFRKTRAELNEIKSMKLFLEKKLSGLESTIENSEAAQFNQIKLLTDELTEASERNQRLKEDLHALNANYDEIEATQTHLNNVSEMLKSENTVLREEVSRTIQELVKLKKSNMNLTCALNSARDEDEKNKKKLEITLAEMRNMEEERKHTELILQSTLQQHSKLIEHLRLQNEELSTKKKPKGLTGWIFGRDETPSSTPHNLNTTCSAPGATPRRILKEHNVVKNLEEEALKMKKQLEMLQLHKKAEISEPFVGVTTKENISPSKEELVLLKEDETSSFDLDFSVEEVPSSSSPTKLCTNKLTIFAETGNARLYINCIANMLDNIYLLGCEDGLYSIRVPQQKCSDDKVKIDGVNSVHQMEFLFELNCGLMIEGQTRSLVQVHLGLLRACAEAAACSKPKIQTELVEGIQDCIEFKYKRTLDYIVLVVSTQKTLNILYWDSDNNAFELKQAISVSNGVTGLCITPNSLLFGNENEKIYELDLKNFTIEDFLDDSDHSLTYVLATRERHTFPLAIVDVGLSGMRPGDTSYTSEYLLCFPEIGVFVDTFGTRSRSANIIWSKLPTDVVYNHPYLFVLHFESLEIIQLDYDSFTSRRVGLSKDCLGEEKEIIPESRFVPLTSPRLLGNGLKPHSVIVGSFSKAINEIMEVCWNDGQNVLSTV